ncbi:hypothetical protein KSC_006420 [Ktedonobacter sp. SOSP1-52]|uniref:Os1348 family NHLP clan protein n=1 Tax=Ktedonobacter sp. SOSP1-52 TaxID=2778366 RepID=UPI001914DE31|nr:Os1348 family NHLP clan protein [Ktedonobacter sp. SOSP1-52]GHO61750.1 hypothetical protein KSC_006420 [Ktedonobacter sp. SOSP1-52]
MSWTMINKILGLAMMDQVFADHLLKEPQKALEAYGIQLPPEEVAILCACQAQTIPELSRQLMEKLGPKALQ